MSDIDMDILEKKVKKNKIPKSSKRFERFGDLKVGTDFRINSVYFNKLMEFDAVKIEPIEIKGRIVNCEAFLNATSIYLFVNFNDICEVEGE